MPYKIPNTFKAQTPLGQSVQNLMNSYFGNLPTPEDNAKAEYMRSGAEAANANAALNRMKLDAYNSGQGVYEKMVNNQEGLSPEESFRQNYAAYQSYLDKIGQTGSSGKVALAMSPWMKGSTNDTINRAQLGSGMATNNTIEGTLQHEQFQNQRQGMKRGSRSSVSGTEGAAHVPETPPLAQGKGRMPYQAVKMQNELTDNISSSKNASRDAGVFIKAIDDGLLGFGPIDDAFAYVRAKTDSSTPESMNRSLFDTWKEDLRNKKLLLNKGTQTEGDAIRAIDSILSAGRDTKTIRANLINLQNAFDRLALQNAENLKNITSNYGQPDTDLSRYEQGEAVDLYPAPVGKNLNSVPENLNSTGDQSTDWLTQITSPSPNPSGSAGAQTKKGNKYRVLP